MTATFLVTLTIPDDSPTTLEQESGDIEDDLVAAGHDVESVKPWARPTAGLVQQPPVDLMKPPPNPFS